MIESTGKKILGIEEYKYNEVRYLLKKGTSNRLFIFFSGFSKKNDRQNYNYVKKSEGNLEDSFLYFLDSETPLEDPRGTYFLGDKKESYLKDVISVIKNNFINFSVTINLT